MNVVYKHNRRAHLIVVCGFRILITSDDLGCHPIRCADESVPATHSTVQLRAYTEVHWGSDQTDRAKSVRSVYLHPTTTTTTLTQQAKQTMRVQINRTSFVPTDF